MGVGAGTPEVAAGAKAPGPSTWCYLEALPGLEL